MKAAIPVMTLLFSMMFSVNIKAQGHNPPSSSPAAITCESGDPEQPVDTQCIEEQLKTTGLGGWVHASVNDQLMIVFTWRKPGNFFVNVQFPMVSKDPKILQRLIELRRHDQIEIKGEFFKNEAPLEHINVTQLKVVKAYDGPEEIYEYDPKLPEQITTGNRLIGKVHIVANGGSVLVVEVGDRVYPVFNEKPESVTNLFRNDKIELRYNVKLLPMRPVHLSIDHSVESPVKVLERIEEGHGSIIRLTGPLVMFPQSPQIKFNVFALAIEDGDDVRRNFTIVNFSDFDLFFAIRDKLQKIWDDNVETAEYDRNKFINRKVMITVEGEKNVVAPTQANPQVVPIKLSDVTVQIIN